MRTFGEISQWCFMGEAEREAVWRRLPQRQRLLRVAAACGALLELECRDGMEWGRLPSGVRYRLDEDGALHRLTTDGRTEALHRVELTPQHAAEWLLRRGE
nr:DUF1289 domain-containing protein [Chromobacterium paludis]